LPPPAIGSVSTTPYQLDRRGTFGSAVATGRGSIGYVSNATTATFSLARGTGAAQNDPADELPGDTLSKVAFNGYFLATDSGFGPTATGYVSVTVAGTAGIAGHAGVDGAFEFRLGGPTGPLLRTPVAFSQTFYGGDSPTAFSKTFTYSSALSGGTIASGSLIYVSGAVTLTASNAGSPSDITPIDVEAGGAPPTATYFAASDSDWHDAAAWAPPAGSFVEPGALVPAIPTNPGERAKFIDNGSGQRNVRLANNAVIGALQIDSNATVRVYDAGEGQHLVLQSTSGDATITVGSTAAVEHVIDTRVDAGTAAPPVVSRGAGVTTSRGTLSFNRSIFANSDAVSQDVTVRGTGVVSFNAGNEMSGDVLVTGGGTLNGNESSSLGSGRVTARDGRLNLNNAAASFSPAPIKADPRGQVNLGFVPSSENKFDVAQDGIVSGGPQALEGLDVGGATPNLTLAPGAVIGHESMDLTPGVGNPKNLPNEPLYVFAISADAGNSAIPITVGTGTESPWRGFGGTREEVTYGGSPATNALSANGPAITIVGDGDLYSAGYSLKLRAPLDGDAFSRANVIGNGTVALEADSPFAGQVSVQTDAALRVNSLLPAVQRVGVNARGTLGGAGDIGNANTVVSILTGGRVDPGSDEGDGKVGTLTVRGTLRLTNAAVLDFDFAEAGDAINVVGDLVLDGRLLINQLDGFDVAFQYVLFTYTGTLTDNGLIVDPLSQPISGQDASLVAFISVQPNPGGQGGTVFLNVPEPSAVGLLLGAGSVLRRRRR
jgi:hypothetical protein